MSLELLNTFATLATCLIVAATAVAALIQLRHLRANNQINSQLAINDLIQSDKFTNAMITLQDLPGMMNDPHLAPAFRGPLSASMPAQVVAMRIAARVVGSNLENVGNMIRHGLTDGRLFIEQFCNIVVEAWDMLEPYTRERRVFEKSDTGWEDFEYLTILARRWLQTRISTFPENERRILPPWNELVSESRDLPQ